MCLECAYGVLTLRLRTRHNGVLGVTHSALRLAQAALTGGERKKEINNPKSVLPNGIQVVASHRRTLRIGGYATGRLYT